MQKALLIHLDLIVKHYNHIVPTELKITKGENQSIEQSLPEKQSEKAALLVSMIFKLRCILA